jgi:hypothetical protein
LVAVFGLWLPAPAHGQCPVRFRWKVFDPCYTRTFFQTLITVTEQTMVVQGMEVEQVQKRTFYVQWTPRPKDCNGNWVVTERIIGVDLSIDIGGTKIEYNSLADNHGHPLSDFFKTLERFDLTFTINPRNLFIERIDGRERLVEKLLATNPPLQPLVKAILSDEALRRMAEPALAAFPLIPVRHGDSWKRKPVLDLGPIGTYRTHYRFSYAGREKCREKIAIKARTTYSPPAANNAGGLPFVIEKSSRLSGKQSGYALFDLRKGRFDSYTMTATLQGYLDIDIGGSKTRVELSQVQNTTIRATDYNPLVAPAQADIETIASSVDEPRCGCGRTGRHGSAGLFRPFGRRRCR